MYHSRTCLVRFAKALVPLFLLLLVSQAALAKHPPKNYPESGKVIASGLNEHTKSHPTWGGQNGSAVHGGGSYSVYSHTYKIETDTKIFELDCGKTAMFHSTGEGCGGDKKLEIGDIIHFRVEKESFYIPIADGSEQKLRILSQELKPESKPDAKPDAKPAAAEPTDAKQ